MRAVKLGPAKWVGLCVLLISVYVSANLLTSDANADEAMDAGSNFDNLDVVDASLNGKVAILRVGSQLGDNNLLAVFAGLKNRTAHRLALEVETIYKDKDGDTLNAGSWIPMTLTPYEERQYRSASISEEAVDYLVRVRRAPSVASTHE
jgi:hypothetical protein